MKLAVISDLHGNYYALAKVLAFLRSQEIDGIIGLGDFVTDGPFPQRDDESASRNAGGVSLLSGAGETGKNICWKISGIRRTGRQVPRQADFWIIRFGILPDRIWNFSNICRQTVFWSEK